MDPLHAPFDPVTLAIPFFVLAIILEIALTRFKAVKAHYETRDTMASLAMGLGSRRIVEHYLEKKDSAERAEKPEEAIWKHL